jgi:cyclase
MKSPRFWMLSIFGVLASLAFFAANSEATPETLQKIADGVWFREGDLKNLGHCNNMIIEMKDYLIVVDANFPSGARAVMADAKKVSSKPVKYVFDTHHHGDHSYGNAIWTEAGAITLAYKGVADEMKRYEPKRWQESAKQRKDVADLKRETVEPPRQTFDKDRFVLEDGTRRVEFHFFGWAHTRGDGFVYLPKEQILCTGDAVTNGPYNYTADAYIGNWPKVARAAQKLKVTTILPGHGEPGGPEVLAGQALYMTELHKAVKAAIAEGRKLPDFKTSLQLPDSVKHWVGPSLPAQVQDAYEEISQGKPHGEILGGK